MSQATFCPNPMHFAAVVHHPHRNHLVQTRCLLEKCPFENWTVVDLEPFEPTLVLGAPMKIAGGNKRL